ncbi:hypothetical protein QQS45_05875 [Alteriqipengyuania flavescens]|uniref:hypothetical protein n=1 Tax=Alteriqipengyuania flavescens TaxID=3053610 RepID=UPI0025B52F4A|nr:hypothetical protein [Alteriqipengyuania flavescens]WJY19743.1 hypothetical protein QQW98_05870 [Alteriqipengyuania flavescens]WJY25683.1 hypothetical protein QQS45_05875 [Alteriqipengyuania flavescens]
MAILKLATLGALGYLGYKAYEQHKTDQNSAAFADGEPEGPFRNAGAESTASHEPMSATDEALDETYPASDATAKY